MADLTTNLGKLVLKNPVMTASGTFGYGKEYAEFFPLDKLGAVVVKGVSLGQVDGNPTPRICELRGGMLNAIGLQNPGVEKFCHGDDYLGFLRGTGATVIVNIWGTSVEAYAEVAARLDQEKDAIHALEVNISCPNIKHGGIAFGTDLKLAAQVVSAVRAATTLPLIVKLSPNVTRIGDFAKAVVDAGGDMVSLINTIPAMAIDIETRRPKLANITGGLSGPAIKSVAVRMVYEAAKAVSVPVIGMGGICDGADAIEFFLAGASAVAVGTAIFAEPLAPIRIIGEINDYLDAHGYASIHDLVGKVEI